MNSVDDNERNGQIAKLRKLPGFLRNGSGKKVFWAWIIYQAIKGTLTLSFIWIPLIYMWWFH